LTENGQSIYAADSVIVDTINTEKSVTFALFHDNGMIPRKSSFNSGDYNQPAYCYSFGFLPPAQGT